MIGEKKTVTLSADMNSRPVNEQPDVLYYQNTLDECMPVGMTHMAIL